jgi:predicted nuclease of restriction endonuclease-like (RecB) superfamily
MKSDSAGVSAASTGAANLPAQVTSEDYRVWVGDLKLRFRSVQLKAAVAVNTALMEFYWELGCEIVSRQSEHTWGSGFIKQLSQDLMREFPEVKGFSAANLKYIRQWFEFWSRSSFGQQPVGQIMQQPVGQTRSTAPVGLCAIPWGHNLAILAKCKDHDQARFYVDATIEHGWSRSALVHQIELDLWSRQGKAVNNFSAALPSAESRLATEVLKDPYVFDFLSVGAEHDERELERDLVTHITQFLVELGAGFAYVGRQVPLEVDGSDFFLDLLFYHVRLHCYVVVELKTVDFQPEFAGKLNFYLTAVDELLRPPGDEPSIGLLLCKNKRGLVAEYSLRDLNKPIGVSTYTLTQLLPEFLRDKLPSIEALEHELGLSEESTHEDQARDTP